MSLSHYLANNHLRMNKIPLSNSEDKCVKALWGCSAAYLAFASWIENGKKGGVSSKRLAVMDDHTDLHILQTQPCSLGSPCLTALLQGSSCTIRHLLPCML